MGIFTEKKEAKKLPYWDNMTDWSQKARLVNNRLSV